MKKFMIISILSIFICSASYANNFNDKKLYGNNNLYLFIIIAALSILFIISIYQYHKTKQKTNKLIKEKDKKIEDLNKELQSSNFQLDKRIENHTKNLQKEINDRKQVDIELKKVLKKAEEANYLKNAFLANMSHEIRTPLNGIIGFSSLLKTELSLTENQELYEYADGIEQSGDRLLHLLTNIIDISRIEANDLEVSLEPCSIPEIVKSTSELFIFKANEKGLKLNVNAIDTPNAIGDKKNLARVLTDVIDNAIKYTEKGFINISTGYDLDKNEVFIRVKDTGIGIDPSYLPNIFEAFRQESLGYSRAYQGAGLGLPIAKRLIDLMNGKIKVESSRGIGTTVTIFLKAETKEEFIPKKIIPKEKVYTEIGLKEQKPKIFIVEDDSMNRLVLEKMLKNQAETIFAVDGDDTLEIINQWHKKGDKFDIMLVDINLPSPWDGIKLMNEIKKRWEEYKKIPFIAQTAYAMSGDKERFLEAGFDDYISKPIIQSKLFNIISNNLKKNIKIY